MDLLDIAKYFDLIDRVEGAVSTFLNADWSGVYNRSGIDGILTEFSACLVSSNAPMIRVSRYSHWRGIDIERLLKRHGVKIWDRGISGDDLYFRVKRRQVRWAEYLLLRAGVPITSVLADPRNLIFTERYGPGSEPPTLKTRS